MLELLGGVLIGVIGASIAWFFIARNNMAKALKVLNYDIEGEIKRMEGKLDDLKDEAREEVIDFLDRLKSKIGK